MINMLRGSQLRRVRILKGITQEEVAKELGCKHGYISMMENEHRSITEDNYRKWVNYLNSDKAKEIRNRRIEKKANR